MANQVTPVSRSTRSRDNLPSFQSPVPDTAVSILSLSVRSGLNKSPIGLVQSISFNLTRNTETYYEIVPYAPQDFGSLTALFNDSSFNDSLAYDGEPTLLIPGVAQEISVTVKRPMIYSSNILESIFKTSGAGEFTTSEMDDPRYGVNTSNSNLSPLERGALGALAGGLVSASRGGSLLGGAAAGAIQALLPSEGGDPNKVRYANLLQQVRPLTLSVLIYAPTQANQIVYGLEFRDGWSTSWTINDMSVDGSVLMEDLIIKFPRVRLYREI